MKNFIQWLAKVFNVNLYIEKTVYKEKIIEIPVETIKEVEKEIYVSLDGEINGNCIVKGNLIVNGYLNVNGEISCFKMKEK